MSKSKRVSSDIISGVYMIENRINHKKYVGSSKDIYGRWVQHERELNKGKHHSLHLQRAWIKYGKSNFDFLILESCEYNDKNALFKCEQKWIDCYKSYLYIYGYNIKRNAVCGSNFASYEDLMDGKYKISFEQFNKVLYYLCDTEIPITKIASMVKVNERSIYQIYFHKNYKVLTKDLIFKNRTNVTNSILTENDVNKIVKRLINNDFNSDIARDFNVSQSTIEDIRHHRTWAYLTEKINFDDISERKRIVGEKSIIQYDLDGNYIAAYSSAREAEKETGIGYKMISRVCNGIRRYTHGYIFKFAEVS